MNKDFKAGDVVYLKSGSPRMTITSEDSDGRYTCEWFDEGKPLSQSFEGLSLKKAAEIDPNPPKPIHSIIG